MSFMQWCAHRDKTKYISMCKRYCRDFSTFISFQFIIIVIFFIRSTVLRDDVKFSMYSQRTRNASLMPMKMI